VYCDLGGSTTSVPVAQENLQIHVTDNHSEAAACSSAQMQENNVYSGEEINLRKN
jgi:hypothetical protein